MHGLCKPALNLSAISQERWPRIWGHLLIVSNLETWLKTSIFLKVNKEIHFKALLNSRRARCISSCAQGLRSLKVRKFFPKSSHINYPSPSLIHFFFLTEPDYVWSSPLNQGLLWDQIWAPHWESSGRPFLGSRTQSPRMMIIKGMCGGSPLTELQEVEKSRSRDAP